MDDRDADDAGDGPGEVSPVGDVRDDASGNENTPGDDWRFDVDELDEEADSGDVESGTPHPEHVLFVLLGAVTTILVFVRLWMLVA